MMRKPLVPVPLAVTSDQTQSLAFDSQRLINCYAETARAQSKSAYAIHGTPGLKPWADIGGGGPIRGSHTMAQIAYVVCEQTLYSVSPSGTATSIGYVGGAGHVIMADNGTQLAIAASDIGQGYLYNRTTGSFGPTTTGTSVEYMNGYLLWSTASGKFVISALLDGSSYDALDFATAESSPDALLRVMAVGSEVWMMGEDTIEPWVNAGALDFPFERMGQTVINKGLAARHSPQVIDNTLFWAGREPNAGGGPIVFRAQGYTPQVISTPAVEKSLEAIENLEEVSSIAYKQNGHLFYGLILPSGTSWFYDVTEQKWHERQTHLLGRWRGNNHLSVYGKHLVGSCDSGQLFELDPAYFYDATDTPLVLDMTLPPFGDDSSIKRKGLMRLDMETGVGTTSGQGSAPKVMGRYSTDRGRTFSNELWRSIGPLGEYGNGVEWTRVGRFRSIVWNFQISDPVKRVLIAGWADVV